MCGRELVRVAEDIACHWLTFIQSDRKRKSERRERESDSTAKNARKMVYKYNGQPSTSLNQYCGYTATIPLILFLLQIKLILFFETGLSPPLPHSLAPKHIHSLSVSLYRNSLDSYPFIVCNADKRF